MKKNVLLFGSLISALTLGLATSCSPDPVSTYFDAVVSENRTTLMIGEKVQINVTMYGTTSDEVTYTSSNERCLSVDPTGLVEAKNPGSATITVQSKSNPELKEEILLNATKSLGQRNPQLQEMADSLEAYNYGNGVRYNGGIKVDIGDGKVMGLVTLSDINLPLTAEVQTGDAGTNVHLRADLKRLINQEGGESIISVNTILRKTLGSLLNKDFDNYLRDQDLADSRYLDLYAFNGLDYYVAHTRNFATKENEKGEIVQDEENPDYKPFAIGQSNFISLLSPLGNTLLGALGGNNEGGDTSAEEGGLDLGSLLTKDGILSLTSTLYNFFDEEIGENYTKLSLGTEALNIINPMWSTIGGPLDIGLGGISVEGWYLPTEFSEISFLVNNEAEGENKFSGFELSIKGLNPEGEEYEFINIAIEQPEELKANYMAETKASIEAYNAANSLPLDYLNQHGGLFGGSKEYGTTTVIDSTKKINELFDMQDTYKVEENKEITKYTQELLSMYNNVNNKYVKDLLYPFENRLNELEYGNNAFFEGYVSSKELTDDANEGKFFINKFENKIIDKTLEVTYTSNNPDIISIDENGKYTGLKQLYNGTVKSGNVKALNNSVTLTANVSYKDETSETQTKKFTQSSIKYVGSNFGFPTTKSTLKTNANFDNETHNLNLNCNTTFDLKSLIALPEGASEVTYSFASKDTKIANIDKETGELNVYTPYPEDLKGNYRNLAGITLTLTYKLGEKTITDNHVFYVNLLDKVEAKVDTTKLVDGVTFDEETSTLTGAANTIFDIKNAFVPSVATYDEGSLSVRINKDIDTSLYSEGKFLAPYYNSEKLDEKGKLTFVDTSSNKDQYIEVSYKVDGVTKIERKLITVKVTGEPKQKDEHVFTLMLDSHYNKETNTFTFKKDEFKDITINSTTKTDAYQFALKEGCTFQSIYVGDSKIASSTYIRDENKVYQYMLQMKSTGKTAIKLNIKEGSIQFQLVAYLVITE